MPSSKLLRMLWGMLLLLSTMNAVRILRQPEALTFFGFAIVVMAVVGAVGSIVALIVVAVRRRSAQEDLRLFH